MMKTFAILICAIGLSACDETPQQRERREAYQSYDAYRQQRTLTKVCRDGTQIWNWNGQLWVYDGRQYPDAKIGARLDEVCQ